MQFPPALNNGCRVWTDTGYKDHGPLEGPKSDVAGNQGGTIIASEKPYKTMDHSLYTVNWDNGQITKHYSQGLFSIGRFRNRDEFENAIKPKGNVKLTVGPRGGFKIAHLPLEYDGQTFEAEIWDGKFWKGCIEPIVRKFGFEVLEIKL